MAIFKAKNADLKPKNPPFYGSSPAISDAYTGPTRGRKATLPRGTGRTSRDACSLAVRRLPASSAGRATRWNSIPAGTRPPRCSFRQTSNMSGSVSTIEPPQRSWMSGGISWRRCWARSVYGKPAATGDARCHIRVLAATAVHAIAKTCSSRLFDMGGRLSLRKKSYRSNREAQHNP